jgi:nucleotide-binding universal stress UspA family protein
MSGTEAQLALRDILVVLDAGAASEGRLHLAMSLARQQGACLSVAFLQDSRRDDYPSGLTVPRLGLVVGSFSAVGEVMRSPTDTAEDRLRDHLRCFRDNGDWHSLERPEAATLIELAQASDLIIVGQVNPEKGPIPSWSRPEEIVINSGRPVLMVPYIGSYPNIGERVLIGWDGSREAARAIHDALPVIQSARSVTLITVRGQVRQLERDRDSMQRVIQHLMRHQISVHADTMLRGSNGIADVLLSRAVDLAVDMIVVGAYHHSPLREALVGGVSRGLFKHMTVPVLMSH